jgi:predicted membrane GTPase involved in stress response
MRRTRATIKDRHTGVLISMSQGDAVAYALWNLEDRGPMMIEPGTPVYEGMIIGEHTRGNDLEVNVSEGQAADQHACFGQGRGRAADHADPDDAGKGAGLYLR